jgi:hypothetical protein
MELDQNPPIKLPNATAVLVLGIASIPMCCCINVVSLAMAIIAIVLYNKDKALYLSNPTAYTESSYSNLKAGNICAIIGLILSVISLLMTIWFGMVFGWEALWDPEAMQEALEDLQNR